MNNDELIEYAIRTSETIKEEIKPKLIDYFYKKQENKHLDEVNYKLRKTNEQLKDNWNKLKEYFNERIEVCDNRLSSPFCNFEKATKERLIFSQCLEKLEELEGSDNNE